MLMNPIIFIMILAPIIIMISSHWLLIWIGFEM